MFSQHSYAKLCSNLTSRNTIFYSTALLKEKKRGTTFFSIL